MKHTFGVYFVIVVFVVFALAVLFPYFARVQDGPTGAFNSVMSSHDSDNAPMSMGQKPILYMSWFWGPTAMASRHYLVYPDSHCEDIYVLWHHYHETHDAPQISSTDFNILKAIPALPSGVLLPSFVPSQKLLIVSRIQNGRWVTCYYNREHLPKEVEAIIDVQKHSDLTQGLQYTNLN